MFYFVRILSKVEDIFCRVEDIFFSVVRKFFFLLNIKFISIYESHKNSIQTEESSNR